MNVGQLIITVVTLASILGVVVMVFNLQYGHGGMVNLGLAAYFAAGAYGYAIATLPPPSGVDQYMFGFAAPPWVGLLAAGVTAGILALLTGPPALRLRGEYLAITTFAFAEVVHSLLVNERRIGNGTVGLSGIQRPYQDIVRGADYGLIFAIVVFCFAGATLFIFRRVVRSPYGRRMEAIRDDEIAVVTSGKSVQRVRLSIFVLGAVFTGFGGALYVSYIRFATPSLFTAAFTFSIIVALVLGGVGSMWRAMVGIFVVVLFEEAVRRIPFTTLRAAQIASGLQLVVFGLLLILFLRWKPFARSRLSERLRRPRYLVSSEGDA